MILYCLEENISTIKFSGSRSRLVRTRPDVHHSVWKQYKIDVAATDNEEMI